MKFYITKNNFFTNIPKVNIDYKEKYINKEKCIKKNYSEFWSL